MKELLLENMNLCDIIDIGCDNMALPKIMFKEMTLQENIDVIKWAYFENNGALSVHDFTIKYFPQLANLDTNLSRNESYKVIEEIVTNDYNKYKDRIKSETERNKCNCWINSGFSKIFRQFFFFNWYRR